MRGEILKVRTDIASQMVRAGEFVTPTNGLTVYAREVLPDGGMKGVMIYDERDDDVETMHTAKSGFLIRNDQFVRLTLQNGNVQQKFSDGTFDLVAFEKNPIHVNMQIGNSNRN